VGTLQRIYDESRDSEKHFAHKSILFIGSESYDAPTITVLQGLQQLGFTIYTLKKPNINSWFCNKVVETVNHLCFDFVLSNLHWGTRWSHYERYNLGSYLEVLIDGDDNHGLYRDYPHLDWNIGNGQEHWREKYRRYAWKYACDPPEALKDMELQPYRWVEPLGDYKPDVVFTSQKVPGDSLSFYLPFGIHEQYRGLYEGRPTSERDIDFAHIPGPGVKRMRMERLMRFLARCRLLPGVVYTHEVRGEETAPDEIESLVAEDRNVHSYHRWAMSKAYFRVLNRTKVLVYPGLYHYPQWDSKRAWEAYASGCLVLLAKPEIDMSEYPVTEVCDFAVFDSHLEFVKKCRFLYSRPSFLDKLRLAAVERAWEYFSPVPIARYFLAKITTVLGPLR
jgi:hypothetical protein